MAVPPRGVSIFLSLMSLLIDSYSCDALSFSLARIYLDGPSDLFSNISTFDISHGLELVLVCYNNPGREFG